MLGLLDEPFDVAIDPSVPDATGEALDLSEVEALDINTFVAPDAATAQQEDPEPQPVSQPQHALGSDILAGIPLPEPSGYTVVEKAEVAIAGAPALVVRARLRARDAVHLQFQAHVALGETWIALVVSGPSTSRAVCEETFDRMVRTLEWR